MKVLLSSLLLFGVLANNLPFYGEDLKSSCDVVQSEHSKKMEGKHTRERKIKKEFTVGASDELEIDNSYGNVDITTWNENRVVIEVTIKTNGDDEDKVEDRLRAIDVDFNQTPGGVSAKTRFQKEDRSWWKNLFDGFNNVNMEINFLVKAPVGNNLVIDNDYGGIYIDKTNGNAKINCDYGKIDIGELNGSSNFLNFDYTRNSRVGKLTNAEINADYSDFEIGEADRVNLSADYTNSVFEKISTLEFSCDYGSLKIDKVKELRGSGDYLSTKINRIFTTANLDMDYGSLSIEKVIKGARSIQIDTDYTGVKIGYDSEMNFDFHVKTSYGGISGLRDLEVNRSNDRNTSKEVSGYYGGKGGTQFQISTSYGSVDFSKKQ
ncbi:hypothetical protein [Christiangramia flava]|uniref:Uncharacterized protein n=1 Tax=Christiangramia flava JLT2011 TaxID=1229726 RepID=A0A1L7I9P0_9FLAO|nr:hypothetical protein [Christiangramia flava]APU70317.1 hypothetical protein GRFL_3593 [Christiangramia flava JLT2011]OSS37561.1 hypothetical protein C723_3532 [Christiangramia flava JLT2011]